MSIQQQEQQRPSRLHPDVTVVEDELTLLAKMSLLSQPVEPIIQLLDDSSDDDCTSPGMYA
ncbi:MAG: hypothetical protein P1U40_01125 [Coxiellaceae bacterium]|nr:hypothetical protein [Coxiellaceae bacterium]